MITFVRRIWKRNGEVLADGPPLAEEEKRKLWEEFKRTHPDNVEPVSGCCDPPGNEDLQQKQS